MAQKRVLTPKEAEKIARDMNKRALEYAKKLQKQTR